MYIKRIAVMLLFLVSVSLAVSDHIAVADVIFKESFDGKVGDKPLVNTWGDRPAVVFSNAVLPEIGLNGSSAAKLQIVFPVPAEHNLSYWSYKLPDPVPLVSALNSISLYVMTNVPASVKIGISPYGFIYQGPDIAPSDRWQKVTIAGAYRKLKEWCEHSKETVENAWVNDIIIAVKDPRGRMAELVVDDIVLEGSPGAAKAVADEVFQKRIEKIRIAPISLIWDEGHRTLENTLRVLDEAGLAGVDLVCLPQESVYQDAEPIPGPTANAIAKKAAQYNMYVVGNLREREGRETYITSFLCDRKGQFAGKYRKSHCMPYETGPGPGFSLGNNLPVFETDFGPIGLTIGTDYYFPEIDVVLQRRGARLIVWSTSPFPVRDEQPITVAIRGRAADNKVCYAVARYAGIGIYDDQPYAFIWTGKWPLGRAQVFDPDGNTLTDSGYGGGMAIATIATSQLKGSVSNGGYSSKGKYALITADKLPSKFNRTIRTRRVIRAAVIGPEPFDTLIKKLDFCGGSGCDIVALWEYIWYNSDEEMEKFRKRNRDRLAGIANAALRNRMYIVIAGELERGFNESIIFDREGKEVGRYTKISQTTPKTWKNYQAGQRVGVFDLDFGRILTKICLDVEDPGIDRMAALYQVDLLLHHTMDAGPSAMQTRLRDSRRTVDGGYFYLRASSTNQSGHRAYIMDPWGMVLGASQFRMENEPVVVTLHLDNRPKYYEWPEEVRRAGPYPDPYKSGKYPVARGDLRAIVLQQRRPGLYRPQGDYENSANK